MSIVDWFRDAFGNPATDREPDPIVMESRQARRQLLVQTARVRAQLHLLRLRVRADAEAADGRVRGFR